MRRPLTFVSCVLVAATLAACGDRGHYDQNGNYVAPEYAQRHPAVARNDEPTTYPSYTRAGYYDYYGNYVMVNEHMAAPASMLPPRGMCRIWMPDREITYQPGVISCDNVRGNVPMGGYVIYGG